MIWPIVVFAARFVIVDASLVRRRDALGWVVARSQQALTITPTAQPLSEAFRPRCPLRSMGGHMGGPATELFQESLLPRPNRSPQVCCY